MKKSILLLPFLLASGCIAQEKPNETTQKPDFRLFMMGNSLTDQIRFDSFVKMSASGGKKLTLGRQTIPGAPIGWIKDHPDSGFKTEPFGAWPNALANFEWDALSLQPFQWGFKENIRDIPPIYEKFIANSPDGQLLIYAQWPDNKGGDWTRKWLEPREKNIMSRAEYEDTVSWLHANLNAKKPARLVPVGHVMHLLEQKAKAGLVPEIQTMWNVYDDGVHLNNVGSFIVGTTFYASIFQRSPEGLSHAEYEKGRGKLTPELAKVIQQTAWEVVATHPMTGVSSDFPPKIVTPTLENAVQNSAYFQEVFPAFGKAPRTFRVASGTLPNGISLGENGVLTGASTQAGTAKFELEVRDATGKSAKRAFELKTVPDSAPQITTTALPAMKQGQYLRVQLGLQSDNAPFKWNTENAKLPPGLSLSDEGVLEGTPAVAGVFQTPISLTDGDTQDPETVTKTFDIRVAPAGDEVFFARRVDWKIEANGRIDSAEKWNFDQKIAVPMQGKPSAEATMDVVYNDDALFVAVMVKDANLIGENWSFSALEDSVNIYLDSKNNREAVYNWDDFRFSNNPNGGKSEVRGGWWAHANTSKIEGGYLVEARWNWGEIRPKLRKEQLANQSFGLEVQVVDVNQKGGPIVSRVGWIGAKNADSDPSGFRTIITKGRE